MPTARRKKLCRRRRWRRRFRALAFRGDSLATLISFCWRRTIRDAGSRENRPPLQAPNPMSDADGAGDTVTVPAARRVRRPAASVAYIFQAHRRRRRRPRSAI